MRTRRLGGEAEYPAALLAVAGYRLPGSSRPFPTEPLGEHQWDALLAGAAAHRTTGLLHAASAKRVMSVSGSQLAQMDDDGAFIRGIVASRGAEVLVAAAVADTERLLSLTPRGEFSSWAARRVPNRRELAFYTRAEKTFTPMALATLRLLPRWRRHRPTGWPSPRRGTSRSC